MVKIKSLHSWQLSPAQALDLQLRLASGVSRSNEVSAPRLIAGVDISVNREQGVATGAVVVLNYPELRLVETKVVSGRVDFPYVPGLLSFREAPLTLAACENLVLFLTWSWLTGRGLPTPAASGLPLI